MDHPTPEVLALVALSEDVDDATLAHVGSCSVCSLEIEALQQVVVVGRSLSVDDRLLAPHPRVWQRVAHAVNDGRVIPLPGAVALQERPPVVPPARREPVPLGGLTRKAAPGDRSSSASSNGASKSARPSDGAELAARRRPTRRKRRWVTPALVAAVALVVGLSGGFFIKGLLDPTPSLVGSTQLNALPQWAGVNGQASLEKAAGGQQTLLVTMEMPANVHPDGTLEVWLSDTRAENMVPMGTMSGLSGRFPVPAGMDVSTHPIIDVSLEPVGDQDPAHSDTSVVRGRLAL